MRPWPSPSSGAPSSELVRSTAANSSCFALAAALAALAAASSALLPVAVAVAAPPLVLRRSRLRGSSTQWNSSVARARLTATTMGMHANGTCSVRS